MIWRNDDISVTTPAEQFRFVHEIFKSFGVTHTIAVIAKDIEQNKELVNYINENKGLIDIQLHCWEHYNHKDLPGKTLTDFFTQATEKLKSVFGVVPTVFYPPWNAVNGETMRVAELFNLKVSNDKCSLEYYIKHNGEVEKEVVNFHGWYQPEVNDLYKALKIYTQ